MWIIYLFVKTLNNKVFNETNVVESIYISMKLIPNEDYGV